MTSQNHPPSPSGLDGLSVFLVETVRWDANHEKGELREAYIVAKNLQAVMDWLAPDLEDQLTEIRGITHRAPVTAIIPNAKCAGTDASEKTP